MPKIALLTCQRLPNLFETDQTLLPLFADEGISARPVIWNDPLVDWNAFDTLVIRNTWDYYTQHDAFINWLKQIKASSINLLNPVDVVLQNIHKFYLRDFERNGVSIIPTLFSSAPSPVALEKIVAQGWEKVVIKPAISAGSYQTKTYQVDTLSKELLQIALEGLRRQKMFNALGEDETIYLEPLEKLLALGKCPADLLIEKWQGELDQDIRKLIAYSAYQLP